MSKVNEADEDPVGLPRPVLVLAFGAGATALAGLFIAAANAAAGLGFCLTSVWVEPGCCTTTTTLGG